MQSSASPWRCAGGLGNRSIKEEGQVEKGKKGLVMCKMRPVSMLVWLSPLPDHHSLSFLFISFAH